MGDTGRSEPIAVRAHGAGDPTVVVLHGGPGAPGSAASLARDLAEHFGVLEPLQRLSGGEPLTVAGHVADLDDALTARLGDGTAVTIVGHSWGAMLGLAYAADHPDRVTSLVLVGCGTFDEASRVQMSQTRARRMDDEMRRRMRELRDPALDADERLRRLAEITSPVDSHDLVAPGVEADTCDARGASETWDDMLRLQREGVYPAAFAAIASPVLMAHGAVDPHPGAMIRESLRPHVPQLEYRELAECGHYPWRERAAREEFLRSVRAWIEAQATRRRSGDR